MVKGHKRNTSVKVLWNQDTGCGMSFTGFSISVSGCHSVQPSRTILTSLVESIGGTLTLLCKYNLKSGHWPRSRCCLKIFYFQLWWPSCSVQLNCCSHLGLPIDTILAHFNPEITLLLQSKFRLKATKGLGRNVENWFRRWQQTWIFYRLI